MVRAKEGKIDVMIGPRSALFTPFPNLGLIVIDEEHETTYKSEQVPRYHARETAIRRAELEDAGVMLRVCHTFAGSNVPGEKRRIWSDHTDRAGKGACENGTGGSRGYARRIKGGQPFHFKPQPL